MDPRWWQIPSPPAAAGDERTPAAQYQQAQADPRVDANGTPSVIYCLRAGSDHGLKAFQSASIVYAAQHTCALPGFGEALTTIPMQEALTHPELEIPQGGTDSDRCQILISGLCSDQDITGLRYLFNDRSDTFSVTHPQGGSRWITAVAAGFVVTQPGQGQPSRCLWDDTEDGTPNTPPRYGGKPILLLYEVTDTAGPSFVAPTLLRVALGPRVAPTGEPPGGHAWSVRAKTYGSGSSARTYAFVGDMRGRLVVFDVSGDQLFSSPSPATTPYLPATPVLSSVASFDFPPDPFDGLRPNITDIEIDANFAYCAVARAGVGIFDISDPLHPSLAELLDTPGLAMGITLRTDERGFRQMLVGDNNCGIRLYGRPGEGP